MWWKNSSTGSNNQGMTIIERDYMESVKRIPHLLSELLDEIKGLRKDMAEIRELLKSKQEE